MFNPVCEWMDPESVQCGIPAVYEIDSPSESIAHFACAVHLGVYTDWLANDIDPAPEHITVRRCSALHEAF